MVWDASTHCLPFLLHLGSDLHHHLVALSALLGSLPTSLRAGSCVGIYFAVNLDWHEWPGKLGLAHPLPSRQTGCSPGRTQITPGNKVWLKMLKVLLVVTCKNIPVEHTVVGAMMPEFEKKNGEINVDKDRGS